MTAVSRAVLGVVLAVLLAACDTPVAPPGESKVEVDTPELRELKAEIGMEPCRPGRGSSELPALSLPCLGGGRSVDLSTLEGPMVINLWRSNCGPCVEEMPALQEFHERHGERVPILGLDINDTMPGAALELARSTGATYPSIADPGAELLEHVRVGGLPAFIWLREDGSYRQSAGGLDSYDEVIESVEQHLGVRL